MPAKIEITEKEREKIKALAGYGMSDQDIAHVVDISEATIKRRFRKELDEGRSIAKSAVQQTAYKMAVGGNCPAMTIFWLKTQCRWREVSSDEKTNETNAAPINSISKATNDPIEAAKIYQRIMKEN